MLRNSRGGNDEGEEEDLVNSASSGHDDLLSAKLDLLLKEKMLQQAKALDTIEWQGKIIPVSNEKLRLSFVEGKI